MIMVRNLFSNGWFQASFMVLIFWGVLNVVFRVSASVLDVNYVIFTCCLFLSSSFALLVSVGKGGLGQETMRSLDTWVYGVVLLLLYVLNLYLFGLVTSTEATLLQRLSIVVSLIIGWLFLNRKSNVIQALGALTVLVGVLILCEEVAQEKQQILYIVILASAFLQATQIFVAEFHKAHKHAAEIHNCPKARCRVVGFVMFVTSVLFLALAFILALTQGVDAQVNQIMPDLPVLRDFMHAPTIFSGLIVGVVLVAPTKVLEFSSAQKIGAHNFLAICCLAPAATLFWEWATGPLTGLSLRTFTSFDLVIGIAISLGGLLAALGGLGAKGKQKRKFEKHLQYTAQNLELVEDSREIVANTLEHFEMDITKSAKALGVPKWAIEAILADGDKVVAFKNFNEVSRRFRTHVSNRDGLTGLLNRSGFMVAFKKALSTYKTGAVLYIDLDKFKPVNDTYGHDAGDAVLNLVARRLEKHLTSSALVTRMGGDEYCAFVPNVSKGEIAKLKTMLERELAQPYKLEAGMTVEISASIGTAHYPENGQTPAELIHAADKGMYGVKHSEVDE